MFRADYSASSFPPDTLAISGVLNFSPEDLAWALFVTGRAPGDETVHGAASFWEFVHRASLIPAYIRRGPGMDLVRSGLALSLDRSEKGALSYALGQAMTGLFCSRFLGVDRLMHVDRYLGRFGPTFGPGAQRPDLFGPSASGWVVAEAKGRSNAMESGLRDTLEAQKRSVRSIGGAPPHLALGCVASFPPSVSSLRVDAFDPAELGRQHVDLDVDPDRYALAYYEPWLLALGFGQPEEYREGISVSYHQALGIRLGLPTPVVEAVRRAKQGDLRGLAERVSSILAEPGFQALRSDGTLVETEWDNAISLEDWRY